jgi:hypothetical protein
MTGVIFIIQNGQLIELKEQPQHQADCTEIASEPLFNAD